LAAQLVLEVDAAGAVLGDRDDVGGGLAPRQLVGVLLVELLEERERSPGRGRVRVDQAPGAESSRQQEVVSDGLGADSLDEIGHRRHLRISSAIAALTTQ
jgi:hypothetical protein